MRKLYTLQYLRAFAALAVVYSHATIQVPEWKVWLPHAGAFGVDVFFVISGFIMVYIARPEDTPANFMSHRIRRVVPLYWFFTVLMATILVSLPNVFRNASFEIGAFFESLLFIPHWSIADPNFIWPILAPGWSLNYEMYFYLAFAASLLLPPRFRIAFIAAVIGAIWLLCQFFGNERSAITGFYGDSIVFEFVFGMLLARAFKGGFELSNGVATVLIVFGTLLLVVLELAQLPLPRIVTLGIPSLMLVTGVVFLHWPRLAWLEYLGDASYALYLSHIFVLGVLRAVLPRFLPEGPLGAWLFVFLSLVICTLASIFFHRYVDNWLLRTERLSQLRPRSV
ncbi:MAG: hypothetical protein CSB44_03960 [Gammaproteobacteria bacterium]|nr:MAG: hypothetical protein CSB44_03960 [Gammaproteobacteria bacterium]